MSTLKAQGAKSSSKSSIGAPAQHNQSSRKGKKAWRKNVDLEDVEGGLEELRAEERVTGKLLQKTTDEELFVVDTVGDEHVRKTLPHKFSTSALTSTKILAQRSAVPPVYSRTTSTNAADRERKRKMSREEKDKLLRIAKKPRKGPFNSVMDPSEYKAGDGVVELSRAVKESGGYDPWASNTGEPEDEEDEVPVMKAKKVKAPVAPRLRDDIHIPAVSEPHQGASYNPPVDAHQQLILQAAEAEEKRWKELDKFAEVKAKMEKGRITDESTDTRGAPGMKIDGILDEDVREEDEADTVIVKPRSMQRKTKTQRNKELKLRAEKQTLAEKAATKRLMASISLAKGLRRSTARLLAQQEVERAQKKVALKEKLKRQGLAGRRLGKHKVPEGQLEVQLGEDLTESLRGLKPEGNLFKDRFLSLQQRALIEPRVPVVPKKRRARIIESDTDRGRGKAHWLDLDRHGRRPHRGTDSHYHPAAAQKTTDCRTAIDRLVHIVKLCPDIATDAFNLAIQHIHQSRDPSLYQNLLTEYEHLLENPAVKEKSYSLPPALEIGHLDSKWVDEVTARNQSEKAKLEVELKTYTNNMIKESIRMAHRDLAEFYRSVGEYQQSLRHHTKSREFCATSQHVLDMCLSVLELLIEQRNYSHLSTYVFKAEAALDATAAAAASTNNGGNGTTPTSTVGPSAASGSGSNSKKKAPTEREIVQSRLELAQALSHLGQGNYEKAAQAFLRIGAAKELGDWVGKLITSSDIAIYGTLCALASMSRSAIKAQLLDNAVFALYIEQEPYVRELLEAYINSNFKTALELLSKYSTRHYIDVHLSQHVNELTNKIKNNAVLGRMAEAFGWTVDMVEQSVVSLIQSGEIQGRVDSQNKVLYAKKTDYRGDLFARAMQAGNEILSANRKVLLRMRLQQAELIVKPPKGHAQQYAMGQDYYPE
ncbi:hypothetical protein NP233_g1464 [Leucocoprinus birnbaumii]|uniref:Ribosome biogenesis protein NOP53 n=1 Tax=Leucocoprinus birnbaumii TaxID=56174 RepID=A0AAD5W430_9AGAR|nr:hypothetical protein NP233_g1464 [Leucocoprinus birnbaumii]